MFPSEWNSNPPANQDEDDFVNMLMSLDDSGPSAPISPTSKVSSPPSAGTTKSSNTTIDQSTTQTLDDPSTNIDLDESIDHIDSDIDDLDGVNDGYEPYHEEFDLDTIAQFYPNVTCSYTNQTATNSNISRKSYEPFDVRMSPGELELWIGETGNDDIDDGGSGYGDDDLFDFLRTPINQDQTHTGVKSISELDVIGIPPHFIPARLCKVDEQNNDEQIISESTPRPHITLKSRPSSRFLSANPLTILQHLQDIYPTLSGITPTTKRAKSQLTFLRNQQTTLTRVQTQLRIYSEFITHLLSTIQSSPSLTTDLGEELQGGIQTALQSSQTALKSSFGQIGAILAQKATFQLKVDNIRSHLAYLTQQTSILSTIQTIALLPSWQWSINENPFKFVHQFGSFLGHNDLGWEQNGRVQTANWTAFGLTTETNSQQYWIPIIKLINPNISILYDTNQQSHHPHHHSTSLSFHQPSQTQSSTSPFGHNSRLNTTTITTNFPSLDTISFTSWTEELTAILKQLHIGLNYLQTNGSKLHPQVLQLAQDGYQTAFTQFNKIIIHLISSHLNSLYLSLCFNAQGQEEIDTINNNSKTKFNSKSTPSSRGSSTRPSQHSEHFFQSQQYSHPFPQPSLDWSRLPSTNSNLAPILGQESSQKQLKWTLDFAQFFYFLEFFSFHTLNLRLINAQLDDDNDTFAKSDRNGTVNQQSGRKKPHLPGQNVKIPSKQLKEMCLNEKFQTTYRSSLDFCINLFVDFRIAALTLSPSSSKAVLSDNGGFDTKQVFEKCQFFDLDSQNITNSPSNTGHTLLNHNNPFPTFTNPHKPISAQPLNLKTDPNIIFPSTLATTGAGDVAKTIINSTKHFLFTALTATNQASGQNNIQNLSQNGPNATNASRSGLFGSMFGGQSSSQPGGSLPSSGASIQTTSAMLMTTIMGFVDKFTSGLGQSFIQLAMDSLAKSVDFQQELYILKFNPIHSLTEISIPTKNQFGNGLAASTAQHLALNLPPNQPSDLSVPLIPSNQSIPISTTSQNYPNVHQMPLPSQVDKRLLPLGQNNQLWQILPELGPFPSLEHFLHPAVVDYFDSFTIGAAPHFQNPFKTQAQTKLPFSAFTHFLLTFLEQQCEFEYLLLSTLFTTEPQPNNLVLCANNLQFGQSCHKRYFETIIPQSQLPHQSNQDEHMPISHTTLSPSSIGQTGYTSTPHQTDSTTFPHPLQLSPVFDINTHSISQLYQLSIFNHNLSNNKNTTTQLPTPTPSQQSPNEPSLILDPTRTPYHSTHVITSEHSQTISAKFHDLLLLYVHPTISTFLSLLRQLCGVHTYGFLTPNLLPADLPAAGSQETQSIDDIYMTNVELQLKYGGANKTNISTSNSPRAINPGLNQDSPSNPQQQSKQQERQNQFYQSQQQTDTPPNETLYQFKLIHTAQGIAVLHNLLSVLHSHRQWLRVSKLEKMGNFGFLLDYDHIDQQPPSPSTSGGQHAIPNTPSDSTTIGNHPTTTTTAQPQKPLTLDQLFEKNPPTAGLLPATVCYLTVLQLTHLTQQVLVPAFGQYFHYLTMYQINSYKVLHNTIYRTPDDTAIGGNRSRQIASFILGQHKGKEHYVDDSRWVSERKGKYIQFVNGGHASQDPTLSPSNPNTLSDIDSPGQYQLSILPQSFVQLTDILFPTFDKARAKNGPDNDSGYTLTNITFTNPTLCPIESPDVSTPTSANNTPTKKHTVVKNQRSQLKNAMLYQEMVPGGDVDADYAQVITWILEHSHKLPQPTYTESSRLLSMHSPPSTPLKSLQSPQSLTFDKTTLVPPTPSPNQQQIQYPTSLHPQQLSPSYHHHQQPTHYSLSLHRLSSYNAGLVSSYVLPSTFILPLSFLFQFSKILGQTRMKSLFSSIVTCDNTLSELGQMASTTPHGDTTQIDPWTEGENCFSRSNTDLISGQIPDQPQSPSSQSQIPTTTTTTTTTTATATATTTAPVLVLQSNSNHSGLVGDDVRLSTMAPQITVTFSLLIYTWLQSLSYQITTPHSIPPHHKSIMFGQIETINPSAYIDNHVCTTADQNENKTFSSVLERFTNMLQDLTKNITLPSLPTTPPVTPVQSVFLYTNIFSPSQMIRPPMITDRACSTQFHPLISHNSAQTPPQHQGIPQQRPSNPLTQSSRMPFWFIKNVPDTYSLCWTPEWLNPTKIAHYQPRSHNYLILSQLHQISLLFITTLLIEVSFGIHTSPPSTMPQVMNQLPHSESQRSQPATTAIMTPSAPLTTTTTRLKIDFSSVDFFLSVHPILVPTHPLVTYQTHYANNNTVSIPISPSKHPVRTPQQQQQPPPPPQEQQTGGWFSYISSFVAPTDQTTNTTPSKNSSTNGLNVVNTTGQGASTNRNNYWKFNPFARKFMFLALTSQYFFPTRAIFLQFPNQAPQQNTQQSTSLVNPYSTHFRSLSTETPPFVPLSHHPYSLNAIGACVVSISLRYLLQHTFNLFQFFTTILPSTSPTPSPARAKDPLHWYILQPPQQYLTKWLQSLLLDITYHTFTPTTACPPIISIHLHNWTLLLQLTIQNTPLLN